MLTIQEMPYDEKLAKKFERHEANAKWFNEHGAPFFETHRGQYIAVSMGLVFAGATRQEAERLAHAAHPDDEPFVKYMPIDNLSRIYAY